VVSVAVDLRTRVAVEEAARCEITSQNTGKYCVFGLGELPSGRAICNYVKPLSWRRGELASSSAGSEAC